MVTPEELLAYAEAVLVENQVASNEIALRAAVSRAYYGAYHACRDFEASLPLCGRETESPGGVHERLVQRLGNPDSQLHADLSLLSRKLSALLRQAREARERADYRLAETLPFDQATVAVLETKRIVQLVHDGKNLIDTLGLKEK